MKSHPDLIFSPFMHGWHSSLLISKKPSTRLDKEVGINLKLSIKFSLCVIFLPLSSFFLIGTEKLISVSIFSPIHSN